MEKFITVVIVKDDLNKALKQFKKVVEKFKILETYKNKQYYEKPSQKKRKKRNRR